MSRTKQSRRILRSKVIHTSIPISRSLARCSLLAHAFFDWFMMLGDDHGCFEIDVDTIYGYLFCKRSKEITVDDVLKWLKEYEDNNMLFRWKEGVCEYGFFIHTAGYNHIAPSKLHKRETPPPPEAELKKYRQRMAKKFGAREGYDEPPKEISDDHPTEETKPTAGLTLDAAKKIFDENRDLKTMRDIIKQLPKEYHDEFHKYLVSEHSDYGPKLWKKIVSENTAPF